MSTTTHSGPDTSLPEVHSPDSRYDGSRTSPEIQYEIMRRHRQQLPLSTIAEQVGCDPRTVKAVIENWGNAAHRLRLEAHKAQLIDAVLVSWDESAKRGKSDSLRGWTDSLGITEPVKAQAGTQVAVQVNLHGGPEPVSLAKVRVDSEGLPNQAENSAGLIMGPMTTTQPVENTALHVGAAPVSVAQDGEQAIDATFVAESWK